MPSLDGFLIYKLTLIGGLAAWLSLGAFNNVINFAGGAAALGGLMSMRLFDEAPAIKTPLLARRVTNPAWPRRVLIGVLAVEIMVAALLWIAAVLFGGALLGATAPATATRFANLALAGLLGLVFVFALGGAWFVYYIRQEAMQLTHLALMLVAIGAGVIINLR